MVKTGGLRKDQYVPAAWKEEEEGKAAEWLEEFGVTGMKVGSGGGRKKRKGKGKG